MELYKSIHWFCISLLIISLFFLGGCKQFSETETDPSAGLNGGFEVVKNGLPVNWIMYTPNTVPNSDFKIKLDQQVYKQGKQSLRFDIISCTGNEGWNAPGFTNEFIDGGKFWGKGKFKLSFWVKNKETTFMVSSDGVSALEGNMNTLIKSGEELDDWEFFEFKIDVEEDQWLRMELNILSPGTFWIDDIRIERI